MNSRIHLKLVIIINCIDLYFELLQKITAVINYFITLCFTFIIGTKYLHNLPDNVLYVACS